MTTTWWDGAGLSHLVLGSDAAVEEFRDATSIAALVTVEVDTLAQIVGAPQLHMQTNRLARWRVLQAQVDRVPINAALIGVAAGLVVDLRLPATIAWEMAGAMRAEVSRVVSAHDDTLVAAQMLGFRVAHLGSG